MKLQVIDLLKRAKEDGLILHGDTIIGYFFKGTLWKQYTKELQDLAEKNEQHWQEMEVSMEECIKESEIEVRSY